MRVRVYDFGGIKHVGYNCPGCGHMHTVPAERWHWNGDADKPTLSPSVRHFIPEGEWGPEKTTCHYHVTAGKISYCGDCQHDLKNQTIELPEIEP